MPKPPPRRAKLPETVPVPARAATGRHPLDPPEADQEPLIDPSDLPEQQADKAESDTEEPAAESPDGETMTSRRRDVTTSSSKPLGRPPKPRPKPPDAKTAVPYTVRFNPAHHAAIEEWINHLRQESGRRRVDKSEVIRALIDIAREHPPLERALIRELSRPAE